MTWARKVSAYIKGSSELQFLLSNATEKLERAMALPGEINNLREQLMALPSASPGPYTVSFDEWEYYQPPEAVLERTLRLLVDADAAKVVVVAGMFGMGKSSLARHIACNPDKLQKVNFLEHHLLSNMCCLSVCRAIEDVNNTCMSC